VGRSNLLRSGSRSLARQEAPMLRALSIAVALCVAALGCAASTASTAERWPGWRTLASGGLELQAPADLTLVALEGDRFRLERADGPPFMEARLSPWCPNAAEPGAAKSYDGRFASALGSLPGGHDKFFALLAGNDRCLLLRFFSLANSNENNIAERIAASAKWTNP
jgi:hypothetical protein